MIRTSLLTFGSIYFIFRLNREFGIIVLCAFPFIVDGLCLCLKKASMKKHALGRIQDIARDSLRKNVAIVLQDTALFSDTVRNNLKYGNGSAAEEQLTAAVEMSQCRDMIGLLPQGYDTVLTGSGANISQGQRQLLNIARAAISKAPILILDEPTNGLDPVGIHEIRTLVRSLPEKYDCTVLVSSHLLPEVELMADDIGILNHGRLLFEGTLEELEKSAQAAGLPTFNLEETFLAMIDDDNRNRGERI